MRVRRSSDNAESDFSAQEVANGTLLDYVVPTAVQDLYDNRMYFDGSGDKIDLSSVSMSATSFEVDVDLIITDFDSNSGIIGNASSTGIYITSSSSIVFTDGANFPSVIGLSLTANTILKLRLSRDASNIYVYDMSSGSPVLLNSSSAGSLGSFNIDRIGLARSRYMKGVISDVSITNGGTLEHQYNGYGNTNADWEDQIGSNDGTVSGSPALFTGQGCNGLVPIWYDQRVPTSQSYIKPNDATNTYATATNATGVISGKKITFTYHRSDAPVAFEGLFGVTDADGYRFDVYEIAGDLRIFNRDTSITKSAYYDITPTTAFANGETYDIEITYGLDGEAPTDVFINSVAQTVPVSSGSVSPSATTSTWYLHTSGANVGESSLAGVNGISDFKVYDTDGTTLLHHWKLNNVGDGLVDQTNDKDFTVQNGNYTRNSIDDFDTISRDVTQTTAGSQPKIIEDGAIIRGDTGEIGIKGDGVDDYLQNISADWETIQSNFTNFYIFDRTNEVDTLLISIGDGTKDDVDLVLGSGATLGDYSVRDNTASYIYTGRGTSGGTLLSHIRGNSSYLNGTINNTTSGPIHATNPSDRITLFARRNGDLPTVTVINEIIIFSADKSADREKIEGNINRHYKIY